MHPNPIKTRDNFTILNNWEFSFDKKTWTPIRVPFCPESKLSGIGYTDFIHVCYYKTHFTPEQNSERIVLHFGAVDYRSEVFVNGKHVGGHVGGYTPFEFDIKEFIGEDGAEILVEVYDNEQGARAFGKQSFKKNSHGCFYTRTTGIWQPVWLEYTPKNYIRDFYFYPNPETGSVFVDFYAIGCEQYKIEIFYGNKLVGSATGEMAYRVKNEIKLSEIHLWEIGKGELYDVVLTFGEDVVRSYFGLRSVKYDGHKFLLNGKETFQKLVLDQGFNPDGIYTSPSSEFMKKDIQLALDLGFNGARLHQKVFEPEFLYHCDKAGYIVWGEYPSWGVDNSTFAGIGQFIEEWEEELRRDFNHPSIVTWCPLNEMWGRWDDYRQQPDFRYPDVIYDFTKRFDTTRPCVDASGGVHGEHTDVFDFHSYHGPEDLKKALDDWDTKGILYGDVVHIHESTRRYKIGEPVNLSEYGGIAFVSPNNLKLEELGTSGACEGAWGYGKGENDGDKFVERYRALTELALSYSKLSGYCYTQLYDVEQEQNGFYNYDRTDKLTAEQKRKIKEIQSKR